MPHAQVPLPNNTCCKHLLPHTCNRCECATVCRWWYIMYTLAGIHRLVNVYIQGCLPLWATKTLWFIIVKPNLSVKITNLQSSLVKFWARYRLSFHIQQTFVTSLHVSMIVTWLLQLLHWLSQPLICYQFTKLLSPSGTRCIHIAGYRELQRTLNRSSSYALQLLSAGCRYIQHIPSIRATIVCWHRHDCNPAIANSTTVR